VGAAQCVARLAGLQFAVPIAVERVAFVRLAILQIAVAQFVARIATPAVMRFAIIRSPCSSGRYTLDA
jgi:hypothetical protein